MNQHSVRKSPKLQVPGKLYPAGSKVEGRGAYEYS